MRKHIQNVTHIQIHTNTQLKKRPR